jgi:3-hydroxyacyl-CoA dehydrogenase
MVAPWAAHYTTAMTQPLAPRFAVVGAGETGLGWAALAVGAGWHVAIYDPDSSAMQQAAERIATRARALVRLGRAEQEITTNALHSLRVGRSLLHAVTDADWIIEATALEEHARQRLLEQMEQVARLAAVTTSCATVSTASALSARLHRPERLMVIHPGDPVELSPLVEVVPGALTDPDCVEDVRNWLTQLQRVPVILHREVPAGAVSRIRAAVWRECIALVLEGVVDAEDIDRLVGLGPALGWMAAGPNLSVLLEASARTPAVAVRERLTALEPVWQTLADWVRLEPEEQTRLVRALERACGEASVERVERRAARLAALADALRRADR